MHITTMQSIGIQVPLPQKTKGFNQILLPFKVEVWVTFGNIFSKCNNLPFIKFCWYNEKCFIYI